jgi:hypothetical protein
MYPLLLAAGIVGIALVSQREHLAFTETIKDVRGTVDAAELDRVYRMAPASLQRKAVALNAQLQNSEDRSKRYILTIIGHFQSTVYVPATAPITEEVVNNYISQTQQLLLREREGSETTFYRDAFSNGDAKALLLSYLGLARGIGTIPPLSSVPTSSTSASVPQLLEQMRDNLLEYKMTGQPEYKSVYEGTKAWLDQYISNLSESLTREADAITTDVNAYRSSNSEMAKAQADFQTVKTQGPRLEDTYTTVKTQMDQVAVPSSSGSYVKAGIAAGLLAGAVGLSFF